ncbi:MAG: hypothetical protein GX637_04765 [Clostridiales bacterium]|nr:hypothetical protein [Clostridiales bacterium]
MNTFSNSLFTFLFGWARSLIEGVWNAAAEGRLSAFFSWLGDHWLIVAAVLILLGTALDFLIWLIRWRPYLVWRSTLRRWGRRLRGEKVDSRRRFSRGYQQAVDLQMPPASGHGGAWEEEAPAAYEPPAAPASFDQQPLMDEFSAPEPPGDAPAPDMEDPAMMLPEGRRRRRSEKHGQTWKPAWRPRFSVLSDPEDESMLDGLPPAVDRQQAFHDPVYPSAPQTAWPRPGKNDHTTGA